MSSVIAIVLIGLGGFLIGGVLAFWSKSKVAAVVFAVFAAACIVGGILWLVGAS